MKLPTYHQGTPKKTKLKPPHGSGPTHTLTIPKAKKGHKAPKPKAPVRPVVNPMDLPFALGSPTTLRQINSQADTAATARYGAAENQLAGAKVSTAQWFNNYQRELADLQTKQQARQDQTAGLLKSIGEGSAALSVADASRLANSQSTDAAQRGATASAEVNSTAIQAARNRDALNAAYQSVSAIQGQNADRYAGDRIANTGQSKLDALGKLFTQGTQLQTEKGQYRNQYLDQAKNAERTYGLNLEAARLAGAKFKADVTKPPSASEQKTTADLKFFQKHGYYPPTGKPKGKSAGEKKTEADLAFFQKHGYYPSTGPPSSKTGTKDKFGNTAKQRQAANTSWGKAKSNATFAWQHARTVIEKNYPGGGWKSLEQYLITIKNVDPLYARAAAQRLVQGHVAPGVGKQLARRGVKAKTKASTSAPKYVGPDQVAGDTKGDLP